MTLQLKILHFETSRTMFIVVVIVMLGSKSLDRIPILKNVDMSHVHILINSCTFVCLFVCLFIVPLENFTLIRRRHRYRRRAAHFDLCSTLTTIDQWGFFSGPHLLWHGESVFTVISEDPWHKLIAERLAVVLSLPVFTFASGIRTSNLPLTHCANAVVIAVRVAYIKCIQKLWILLHH